MPEPASPPLAPRLSQTVLHDRHVAAGARLAPFAGWELPIEYPSGIFAEHTAVRAAAGLFDISHMGIFEVTGPQALDFLECLLANEASRLVPGRAQYSYLLKPDGSALDDLYVYRLGAERFWLVVNAANAERDFEWLSAVNEGRAEMDPEQPQRRAPGPVVLRDLRGGDATGCRVLLALQGPRAADLLAAVSGDSAQPEALRASRLNDILPEMNLDGIPVMLTNTGYTGEERGFEVFVHPVYAPKLWDLLLTRGRGLGVLPCGLGARDSLRLEAGLPLFGHELEGPQDLSLTEADYGFIVRLKRPFFVGREAYIRRTAQRRKRLLRLAGQGRRSVRAGHAVLDDAGRVAGVVTSFAFCDAAFRFCVLAAVRADFTPPPGVAVRAVRAAPADLPAEPDPAQVVELTVLPRFPTPEERAGWKTRYRPG